MLKQILMAIVLCAALVAVPAYATQGVYTGADVAALQVSAQQGDSRAKNHLAVLYAEGTGVKQDYKQAAAWFRSAAEQGDAFGAFSLATLYSQGLGLPQDHAKAAKWYQQAAKAGDTKAQYILGRMHYMGKGVTKSEAKAIDYFIAASRGGEKGADKYLQYIQFKNQSALREIQQENTVEASLQPFAHQTASETAGHSLGVVYLQGLGAAVSLEAIFLWIVLPILCMLGLFAL
ncbi:MAG TPA: tetratricopeptide repeat protein [Patescibacteria group bacterium]|nr:tetratricopeptide repeat protein [Patescibacteria group bacterium]